MRNPSCLECKHAFLFGDDSVGLATGIEDCWKDFGNIPTEEIERLFDEAPDDLEEILASLCNHFELQEYGDI